MEISWGKYRSNSLLRQKCVCDVPTCVFVCSMPIARSFDFTLKLVALMQKRCKRCSRALKHWQIIVLKWLCKIFFENGVESVVVAVTPGTRIRMGLKPWYEMNEPVWQRWVNLTSRLLVPLPCTVETPTWAPVSLNVCTSWPKWAPARVLVTKWPLSKNGRHIMK